MRELDDHPDIKAALLTGYPRGVGERCSRYKSRLKWRAYEPEESNEYIPEEGGEDDE